MKGLRILGAALLALVPLTALALPPSGTSVYILATGWEMDGEAADADQVVASAALADSTSYTVAADPDVCRLVDITVTDANSSITDGVLTVVGTDCWDAPLTATFTFAAGGSGVQTLTVSAVSGGSNLASAAYFKTVTSVDTGVLTGEGAGDAVTVGYTSNSEYGYPLYGVQHRTATPPYRWVDLNDTLDVRVAVYGASSPTTAITAVTASSAPFATVSVGDLVGIWGPTAGTQWRKVTASADTDNITLDRAVEITTDTSLAKGFVYKKFYLSTDPQDGWFGVQGFSGAYFLWTVDKNTNTGGVVSNVECGFWGTASRVEPSMQVDTDTVASAATGQTPTAIDLTLAPFDLCRIGLKFGTGDDADATGAAEEDLNISVGLSR